MNLSKIRTMQIDLRNVVEPELVNVLLGCDDTRIQRLRLRRLNIVCVLLTGSSPGEHSSSGTS